MMNLKENAIIILKRNGYAAFIQELKKDEKRISSAIVNFYFPKKFLKEYSIGKIEDEFLITSEFYENH